MNIVGQFGKSLLRDRMKWQDYLRIFSLVLSVDAAFLWSVSYLLTEGALELIDITFLLQLQFRIFGTLILCWFVASLISSFVRIHFVDLPIAYLQQLRVRRLQRIVMAKGRLEFSVFALLIGLLLSPILSTILFTILFLAMCALVRFPVGALMENRRPEFSRRLDAADLRNKSGRKRARRILERAEDRIDAQGTLLPLLLLLCVVFVSSVLFAKKLQTAPVMTLDLGTRKIDGVVLGQTSYGFLIWNADQCDCIGAISFSSVQQIRP